MERESKMPSDLGLKDLYRFYRNDNKIPQLGSKLIPKSKLTEDYPLYSKIVKEIFKSFSHQILLENRTLNLPFNLGEIRIEKKKMDLSFLNSKKRLKLNYKHWKETGEKKFHLNEHSNFYRYKWLWKRNYSTTRGRNFINPYVFLASRKNKRHLAEIIINQINDFME